MEGTLFLAATRSMGIGQRGRIPWKGQLPSENAYFHRISKKAHPGTMNAVIMGRKSWDARSWKPLSDRINVIVTRNPVKVEGQLRQLHIPASDHVHVVSSLDEAYQLLHTIYGNARDANDCALSDTFSSPRLPKLGRIFLTGGIFAGSVLNDARTTRFLLSIIDRDYECDAFIPLMFNEDGAPGWQRSTLSAHARWLGEAVPGGLVCESGVSFEYMMLERD